MKRKIISLLLSVVMVLTMIPSFAVTALAAPECDHIFTEENIPDYDNEFWDTHSTDEYFVGSSSLINAEVPASCTEDGWRLAKNAENPTGFCVVCGQFLYNGEAISVPPTAEDTKLPATGHTFEEEEPYALIDEATCTEAAVYECANVNYTLNVTQDEDGYYYATLIATECEETASLGDPLGHDWGEWEETIAPSCVDPGQEMRICNRCQEEDYRDVDPAGHVPGEAVEEPGEDPTCTEDGYYDLVTYCEVCGDEVSRESVTIPALGHDLIDVEALEPTCTESGYTEGKVCSRCDYYEGMEEVPALGHDFAIIDHQDVTCTADGYDVQKCSRCGKEELINVVPKYDHKYQDGTDAVDWKTILEADCENQGIKEGVCALCGRTLREVIPATGHDYQIDEENSIMPGCETYGNIVYVCQNDPSHTYREYVDPIGHDYVATEEVEATCTEDGYIIYVCQNDPSHTYTELTDEALGHIEGEPVIENEVEATCETADSYDVVVYCERCGVELSRETIEGEALGHIEGEPVYENLVNCEFDENGAIVPIKCAEPYSYDVVVYCEREENGCGHSEISRDPFEFPAAGHIWVEEVSERIYPTCTEWGRTVYVCRRCGERFIESVDPLGHTFEGEDPYELVEVANCVHGDIYVCQRQLINTVTGDLEYVVSRRPAFIPFYAKELDEDRIVLYYDADEDYFYEYDYTTKEATPTDYRWRNVRPVLCGEVYEDGEPNYDLTFTADSDIMVGEDGAPVDVNDDALNGAPYYTVEDGNKTIYGEHATGKTVFQVPTDEIKAFPADTPIFVSTTGEFEVDYGTDENGRLLTGHIYDIEYVEARCEYDAYYIATCTRDEYIDELNEERACPYTDAETAKNEQFIVVIPNSATGHRWALRDDGSNVDPHCTTDGTRHWFCLNDHNHIYTEKLPATGHNYQLVETIPATCGEDGKEIYECFNQADDNDLDSGHGDICGAKYEKVIPATGEHKFSVKHIDATCTKEGYDEYTCDVCGYTYTVATTPAKGHDWQISGTTAATCTEEGYDTYTCKECGDTYNKKTTPALGHEWKVVDTVAATCSSEGYDIYKCTRCDDTYNKKTTPKLAHEFVAVGFTDATCTEVGYHTYKCANCDYTYNGDYVPAKGHKFVADVVAPTCSEAGYTYFTCSVCGENRLDEHGDVYTTNETLPVPHVLNTIYTIAPTCGEDGKKVSECINCDYVQEEVLSATGNHQYDEVVTKQPTCAEKGILTYTCSVCGYTYTEELPEIDDHQYSNTVKVAADCGNDGILLHKCDICGEEYETVIPATGDHTYDEVVTKQPTCAETGLLTYTCSVCGFSYTEELPKIDDHQYSTTVKKAADCGNDGVMLHKCDICGEEYETVIPATGDHTYDEVVTKQPTCAETGILTYTCSVCGFSYTEELPKIDDHQYTETVKVAATCAADGVMLHKCDICGEEFETVIPATADHTYDVTVELATCAETGLETHTCSVCGYTYYVELPTTADHKYQKEIVKAATADHKGIDRYTCTVCGVSYDKETPALVINGWYREPETGKWTFRENSAKRRGWLNFGGANDPDAWYYLGTDGYLVYGWNYIDGSWYYFDLYGKMAKGWNKLGGKWYFMDDKGHMSYGWVKSGNTWYYMDNSGAMVTGWKKIGGNWYYFKSSGAMATGWQYIGSDWYYFNNSGSMRTSNLTYKGKVYKFASSGACINP